MRGLFAMKKHNNTCCSRLLLWFCVTSLLNLSAECLDSSVFSQGRTAGAYGLPPSSEDVWAAPNTKHEQIGRRLKNNVREFWFYMFSELNDVMMKNLTENLTANDVYGIAILGNEYKRMLLSDLEGLKEVDGYGTWRAIENTELSDLVQRRLHYLQNPKDCDSARKLICPYILLCGLGCQIHRALFCFGVAYRTERTIIMKHGNWSYNQDGWNSIFLPVSELCLDNHGTSHADWPCANEVQVVDLSLEGDQYPPSSYPPLALPEDLAPRLEKLHGEPYVWLAGQFLKYLLRPQKFVYALLQEFEIKIGFKRPIVGLHIRRTDKEREAPLFPIWQYMLAVEEYYRVLEITQEVPTRRIYLATDETDVIRKVKENYPQYEILSDMDIADSASFHKNRTNYRGLLGIIIDIHFLSQSDYIVCTFSSNVCRLAYEIMQTHHPDAADRYFSLDLLYGITTFTNGPHTQIAAFHHTAQSKLELNLMVGDTIELNRNKWDGYSVGRNLRTKLIGMYPSFKGENWIPHKKFPTYPAASPNISLQKLKAGSRIQKFNTFNLN